MAWFKKKMPIESFVGEMIEKKLPGAIIFFENANTRAHRPMNFLPTQLYEVGAGMMLFFLGAYHPDTEKKGLEMMGRAYKEVEKKLPKHQADPKKAYDWWKAFTDVLIFQEESDRLRVACRIVWEHTIPGSPYREPSPLKAFGNFIQMEVATAEKVMIV